MQHQQVGFVQGHRIGGRKAINRTDHDPARQAGGRHQQRGERAIGCGSILGNPDQTAIAQNRQRFAAAIERPAHGIGAIQRFTGWGERRAMAGKAQDAVLLFQADQRAAIRREDNRFGIAIAFHVAGHADAAHFTRWCAGAEQQPIPGIGHRQQPAIGQRGKARKPAERCFRAGQHSRARQTERADLAAGAGQRRGGDGDAVPGLVGGGGRRAQLCPQDPDRRQQQGCQPSILAGLGNRHAPHGKSIAGREGLRYPRRHEPP